MDDDKPTVGRNLGKKIKGGTFIEPKIKQCNDTEARKNAVTFFQYWLRLTEDQVPLCKVKVYRLWPCVDLRATEPNRKDHAVHIFEGAIPFEPDQYISYFQQKFGSGEWRCIMNEEGVSGSIIECNFSAVDLDRFPPMVDLKTVLWDLDKNKAYKRWLQSRNIPIPNHDGLDNDDSEEEMKLATDAFAAVTAQNATMADRLIETVTKSAEAQVEAAKQGSGAENQATSKAIEMVSATAKSMVDMVTKHSGTQYDPLLMIEKIGAVMAPRNGNEMLELMKATIEANKSSYEQALTQQAKQFEFMQTVLAERAANATAATAAIVPPAPPKSMLEQFKELAEFKTIAGDLFGAGKRGAADVPAARGIGDAIGQFFAEQPAMASSLLTTGLTIISGIIFNLTKPKDSAPVSPQEALARANGQPLPLAMQTQQPAQPAPQVQPQAAGQPEPNANPFMQYVPMLTALQRPFLAHFFGESKGLNGLTFADYVIGEGFGAGETEQGRKQYTAMKEVITPEGMDRLLRWFTPIWQEVAALEPRYVRFMAEFWAYDEAMAKQDELEPERVATASKGPIPVKTKVQ